jgi:hypothetical protein
MMRGGLPHQAGQPSSFTILFTPAREICGEKRSIFVLVSRGVGRRSRSCCRAPFIMHHLKADGIWSFHWPALCGVVAFPSENGKTALGLSRTTEVHVNEREQREERGGQECRARPERPRPCPGLMPCPSPRAYMAGRGEAPSRAR